ncbi:MAG: hypothetical protein ACE5JQ_12975 [Candidatus Methylomirabilales bacterium]
MVSMTTSYRPRQVGGPLIIAVMGTVLVLWVIFYSRIVELIGFVRLITTATWDWDLKKCENPAGYELRGGGDPTHVEARGRL